MTGVTGRCDSIQRQSDKPEVLVHTRYIFLDHLNQIPEPAPRGSKVLRRLHLRPKRAHAAPGAVNFKPFPDNYTRVSRQVVPLPGWEVRGAG